MTDYFYTITHDGKKYRYVSQTRGISNVAHRLGIRLENVDAGCSASTTKIYNLISIALESLRKEAYELNWAAEELSCANPIKFVKKHNELIQKTSALQKHIEELQDKVVQ